MKIRELFSTAAPEANYLAGGALLALAAKIFVLNKISELFPGAYETGLR